MKIEAFHRLSDDPSFYIMELSQEEFHKLDSILKELAYGNFLGEDYYSRDYCKYCYRSYGNYNKFGYDKKSTQDNHEPDCLHRLASELLEKRGEAC